MSKKVSEEESKKDIVAFINSLIESDMLYLFYASLISADTLVSLDDCEVVEKQMLEFKEALPKTNLEKDKLDEWSKLIEDGLDIIRRDKKLFQNKK